MQFYVLIVAAFAGLATGVLIWWVTRSVILGLLGTVGLIGLVAVLLPLVAPSTSVAVPTLAMLEESRPIEVPSNGYVTSNACRECHPQNHATWHASYHRTMTQVATPEAVLGDFDDVHLTQGGRNFDLRRDGDVCWVEMPDPTDPSPDAKRMTLPVVMTTGSHHMQAYWLGTGLGRTTDLLPFVFLRDTQEWIPRSAAFLRPEVEGTENRFGFWSINCSQCHSTHRRERVQPNGILWDTRVAEFGISCEACHGPAEDHIRYQRAILDHEEDDSLGTRRDPIVNPESLSHVRSSQVCGQCHAVRFLIEAPSSVNMNGHSFRPGDDLFATHQIWHRDSPRYLQALQMESIRDEATNELARRFYSDGMIRVSGREYNGLLDSACYKKGEMSCLSCHQLHKPESDLRPIPEWANDQLRTNAGGNDVCHQCHSPESYASEHTHHAVGSSGSQCYNCHMPHTTYGLLKAIRNHTISIPDIGSDVAAKRPNACNQCHLDQTLQWSANHLKTWYQIEPPELDADQRDVAASLVWLLKGDAAERAMAAWSMGWSEAQQTAGIDWQAPFLARLLDDPYPAVRLIARRTLRTLPDFGELRSDVVSSRPERLKTLDQIMKQWSSQPHPDNPALLMRDGVLQLEPMERMLSQRDETVVELAE